MSPRRLLILGATSAIAEAYARRRAASGYALTLVGRRSEALETIAADLHTRGAAKVDIVTLDLDALDAPEASLSSMIGPGAPDEVFVAYGVLGEQASAEANPQVTQKLLLTNFVSPAVWLNLIARDMKHAPDKRIVAVGSVAGDRGRLSNYVYGSAKAGLDAFLEGMAHRLASTGTKVVTIKPGFVDTPMTANIKKGGPLWATPDRVAVDIEAAVDRGTRVRYTPWFWRWVMMIIRNVPRAVFFRTKL